MRDVIEALRRREAAAGAVLATVVATRGSTFRKAGAHMLIFPDGELVGSISGGCLEGDVQQIAGEVAASRLPRLVTYDTTAEDDRVWGLGLGCNGVVEVFLEPLDGPGPRAPWFEAARLRIEAGEPVAVATVVEVRPTDPNGSVADALPRVPQRLVVGDFEPTGDFPPGPLRDRVVADALAMLRRGASGTLEYAAAGVAPLASRPDATGQPAGRRSATLRVYVESIRPSPSVVIFGAGHDVIPVVEACGRLGWRVTVVDTRAHLLHPGRFPGAADFVCARPPEAFERLRFGPDSAALVMTHNFSRDLEILSGLLRADVPYIGMLGPRQRLEQLIADLEAQGEPVRAEDLARIRAPVGLDLGAESPEEIAVSIVAELLAVRRGRRGGPLRDRQGPIHDRG